ncbi:MAG: ATP-binding protein, partial [Snowella sp.]|nr:ATP-binding protein [Snowella sp.]
MSQDLITNLYNAFDPDKALPAGDPVYVDLQEVRGDSDIIRDFGHKILRSPNRNTCQLYVGHRGGGKSTELLRLKAELEKQGCFVVYFAADEEDIDQEDAQYTDILIACTRHLLNALKDADTQPLFNWLKERWQDLQDIASLEITVQDLKVENLIPLFAKLSANIRAIPTERAKIREKLNPHTVTLLNALNLFIEDGKSKLSNRKNQLVVIADNLDRIAPVLKTDRTNHDEIFLDRANQLKGLACHVIYTIP